MCGIVAVLQQHDIAERTASFDDALTAVASVRRDLGSEDVPLLDRLASGAGRLEDVNAALRGVAGVRTLIPAVNRLDELATVLEAVDGWVAGVERALDSGELGPDGDVEPVNAALIRLRDATWAIRHDRLRAARAVADLAAGATGPAAIAAYSAIQTALSGLDRLEVRGRDSAGLHVLVDGHGLDLGDPEVGAALERRADPLFCSLSVRAADGRLAFVYKVAAEIGELGDNTRRLRDAIRADDLLRRALAAGTARVAVLGHTRWASVGLISEPNAHPLNSDQDVDDAGPYVAAALNGDIDNHAALRVEEGLRLAPEFTTDAKLIPVLVAKRRRDGLDAVDAFRETVRTFNGSVAIAAQFAQDPDRLCLALRGSGQALYVGLADGAFVIASEPYGLVEETSAYVRMDGETPGPGGAPGQVIVCDRSAAGTLEGLRRLSYEGAELPLGPGDVRRAEVTTRDIDRAGFPHFLLKEITESPRSVRKTLRGKVAESGGRLTVALPDDTLPAALRERLASGAVRRVIAIGQGTAAVAARALAAVLRDHAGTRLLVETMPATELSGFALDDDMSGTLVVAISQSGTTTDTNRTVDLVRAHGGWVVCVVNRRNSDLVEKSHGVLYTSDGRDVEMAVPSTKAFYAQVAAGVLLATGVAQASGCDDGRLTHEMLSALRELPDAMERVLAQRERIADAARRHAPPRRHWALVGNGLNRIAAEELRIKLSELCYKSIPCDATEDKKHIDLSAEPLIVVCAAGLDAATADDVAKEVAIYRAHKAAPIVIATEGEGRFGAALEIIEVPATHPSLAFVLAAMAGHLFGYEAAVAIDGQARALREARACLEEAIERASGDVDLLDQLSSSLQPHAGRFFSDLRSGVLDGHLEASVAVRLASMLRYATGLLPLGAYELEYGKFGSPAVLVEDLADALTAAIDQLTRPIDAIKHQAKTVTVGISRSEDQYFDSGLVRAVLAAGTPRDHLAYRALRTLAGLDPAVAEVTGYTRYRIEGAEAIHVVDKGGVAAGIPSRTDAEPVLRGTKRRAATEREVTVARGRSDDRTLILVPEVKDNQATGLTLLHVRFHDRLEAPAARGVLEAYRDRFAALVDAVTETEPAFRDEVLAEVDVIDLFVQPVLLLAERWRGR